MNQKTKEKPNSLQDYLSFSYPMTLYPEPEGGFVAVIKDLPGCMTQGETPDEVMANIEEARQLWIETAFEYGDEIPLPSGASSESYSQE